MNTKGQVTGFIIAGIIFLILAGFFFYINSETKKSNIDQTNLLPETQPFKFYVDSCLNDIAISGVYLLATNGGYIYSYESIMNTEHKKIAYHLDYENKVGPEVEFMEEELSKFIENSLKLCISKFNSSNYEDIEYGEIDVDSKINENRIAIDVDYPITIQIGKSKTKLSDFNVNLPIKLGHILYVKDLILSDISKNLIDFKKLASYDVQINILPYDNQNIVYSISDNKSDVLDLPLIFNFAIKTVGNSPPEMEFIPDFVLEKGKTFNYSIKANDNDGDTLRFFTDNSSILLDEFTGDLTFNPIVEGDYEIEVCVLDKYLAKDCKKIKFIIKNE